MAGMDTTFNSTPNRSSRISNQLARTSFGDSVNIPLLIVVIMLLGFGSLIVWSATASNDQYSFSHQLIGIAMGVVAGVVLWRIDYHVYASLVIPLLIVAVVLLLLPHVPGIGVTVNNASSWIKIGIQFQTSEPCKIICIVVLASVISRYQGYIDALRDYLKLVVIILIPVACLFTQPDLGTSLVYIFFGAVMIFVGGVDRKWLIITVCGCVGIIAFALILDPILDAIVGHDVFIYEYQLNRLLSFANADLDPDGSGYNVQQAKIAIGSGGFFGKGIGNATQSTLGFLPEAPTDFIFCVLAEELGFVGGFILLVLYSCLFFVIFRIARASGELYGKLICYGIAAMWLFQIFENIGMTCGIMPCTGIPLPFMSYGSSSMITSLMAVGMLMNIWAHRSAVPVAQ